MGSAGAAGSTAASTACTAGTTAAGSAGAVGTSGATAAGITATTGTGAGGATTKPVGTDESAGGEPCGPAYAATGTGAGGSTTRPGANEEFACAVVPLASGDTVGVKPSSDAAASGHDGHATYGAASGRGFQPSVAASVRDFQLFCRFQGCSAGGSAWWAFAAQELLPHCALLQAFRP